MHLSFAVSCTFPLKSEVRSLPSPRHNCCDSHDRDRCFGAQCRISKIGGTNRFIVLCYSQEGEQCSFHLEILGLLGLYLNSVGRADISAKSCLFFRRPTADLELRESEALRVDLS